MKPLDQTDRDWTKGNCYWVALEFLKDSETLTRLGKLPESARVSLVHGEIVIGGNTFRHAWIEVGQVSRGLQSGGRSVLQRDRVFGSRRPGKSGQSRSAIRISGRLSIGAKPSPWESRPWVLFPDVR